MKNKGSIILGFNHFKVSKVVEFALIGRLTIDELSSSLGWLVYDLLYIFNDCINLLSPFSLQQLVAFGKSKHKSSKLLVTLPLFLRPKKKTSHFRMEIPAMVLPI